MSSPQTSNGAAVVRVLEAVHAGTISEHEADAYLRTQHHITLTTAKEMADPHVARHKNFTRVLATGSALVLLLIIAAIFTSTGFNPTGFATVAIDGETASDTTYPLSEPVTSLRVSGTLTGEGEAIFSLDTGTQILRIGRVTSDDGTPRTERASYQPGDSVEIAHLPAGASVYLDDGTTSSIVEVPFAAPSSSAEILIVSGSGTEIQSVRIPLIIGDVPRTTAFSGLCAETCVMPATGGNLIVEIIGDATVRVEATGTSPAPNRAPEIATPFTAHTITETTRIDLGTGFTDADNDDLLYSVGITDLVDARIEGSTLILTPLRSGSIDLQVYASDLRAITESSIPLNVVATIPAENETETRNDTLPIDGIPVEQPPVIDNTTEPENATEPVVNDTIDIPTPPAPEMNLNGTLDCSAADPNQRPVECLLADAEEYFPDEEVFLENLDREKVAKLNMVGNLLITGDIIPNSGGSPGSRDFVIGSIDRDGNVIAAAWVETSSGDLHLRGQLIEAEIGLVPPSGAYSIISKRSIYLAYVDLGTGDMHLRGNVIPYRRSLT